MDKKLMALMAKIIALQDWRENSFYDCNLLVKTKRILLGPKAELTIDKN